MTAPADEPRIAEGGAISLSLYSFKINHVGGPNIVVEGNDRFCYEHEVLAYRRWAEAALAAERTRA